MRVNVRLAPAIAALLLVTACSTAPAPPAAITDIRDQAAQNAEFGNRYFRQANYQLALQFFEQALRQNNSIDERDGVARTHNSLGTVFLTMNDLDRAEESFRIAYTIGIETGNERVLLQSATNLGKTALRRGELDSAFEHLETAEGHRNADSPSADVAVLLHNLAALYARQGLFDRADELLREAMSRNASDGNYAELAANHYLAASILSQRGEFPAARAEALLALAFDKRMENSVGIAADLRALGLISRRMGALDEASNYFERSLYVTVNIGLVPQTVELLDILEELSRERGLTAQADRYREQRMRVQTVQ